DEQSGTGEAEEDEIDRDDIVEDLSERARERDDGGGEALKDDGDDRNPGARADLGDPAEEQAVLGHGEIDARRGQHPLAEEAEGREGDSDGDERGAFPT